MADWKILHEMADYKAGSAILHERMADDLAGSAILHERMAGY